MNLESLLVAEVSIIGTRPLLYNTFTPETLSLEKKEKTGVAGNNPEEWKNTFLANNDGQFFILPSYIFGCMREAAKYTKNGRSSIQGKVAASLQILTNEILINRFLPEGIIPTDPREPVYIDVRSVKNPTTKGRNIRYRVALSQKWETTFSLAWDKSLISRNHIQSVLIDAGTLVGLGDGRGIGFGRFEITDINFRDFKNYLGVQKSNAQKKNAI
ncbi:MAG: hypothetical protein ACQEV7_07000 [Bacillota bacterium]